jgi:sugar phosphate isomerase/epimerase
MPFSNLPLSYCTNVHPGLTRDAVLDGLRQFTVPLQENCGGPIAAGLWLAAPVIESLLSQPEGPRRFSDAVAGLGLRCNTLNAFPYGDFHSARVKEQVYLPDWSDPARTRYTLGCAQVLAELLPPGGEGSLSTVPLGFKSLVPALGFLDAAIEQLLAVARELMELERRTGKTIRLAIEPEPLCVLETTAETVAFFRLLHGRAEEFGLLDAAQRHLGVCYDVCHQAVEFEDVAASIGLLADEQIRINKVHITCAIDLPNPGTNARARAELGRFAEPRYLHQTFAHWPDGRVASQLDLSPELAATPPDGWLAADRWRIHFHVPVHVERVGELETTRGDLRRALQAVRQLDYAPHLEVETYTWTVFPPDGAEVTSLPLVDGLTAEMLATRALLDELSAV